jgi:hypothetical protein
MTKVFISHSSSDKDYALKLAKELRKSNVDVWLDTTELQPGADWQSEIMRAVKSSDTFVTLLSASSVTQRNSLIELGMAWGLDKNIIPVVVPGQTMTDMELPVALQEVKVLDARQHSTSEIAAVVEQMSKGTE